MDKKYLREKWAEAISSIEDFKRHLVEKRKAEKDPKKKEQLQKQIDDANDNIEKIKEKAIVELIQNPTEEIKKSIIEQIPVEQKENIIEEEIEIIKNELKKVK